MDEIDSKILGLLQENARRSFSDLGREVRLSTNAVAARVRRLESDGVILGYTVLTGAEALGPRGGLEVFIDVRLDSETDGDRFTKRIRPITQIIDAVHITGPFDYLLWAHVSDTGALDLLLRRLKTECGALQTQTRVALREMPGSSPRGGPRARRPRR